MIVLFRLEELQVLDLAFLHMNDATPTIAVLYQDAKETRHLKTYRLDLKDKDLLQGPWSLISVENDAEMLIPVIKPHG
jgi:DNA damage-binding protein 1